MYDQDTAQLIRRIPRINGVAVDRLPELLTQAYVEIAALRLRFGDVPGAIDDGMRSIIRRLRVLSEALEIYAALAIESDNRDSAAFVSATAHQLLAQAHEVLGGAPRRIAISADALSPSISAALLFLAAGYPADASEIMRAIPSVRGTDVYAPLLRALVAFCVGNLQAVLDQSLLPPLNAPDEVLAEFSLWKRILAVMWSMAGRYLGGGEAANTDDGQIESLLQAIRSDSGEDIVLQGLQGFGTAVSAFPGPNHLATLLLAAARGLRGRATIDVPPPPDLPPDRWNAFIRRRTRERPFLWTNHMFALKQGLLNPGMSGVISFPTGAGKSTLAELKIAATLLAGRKVVYLAPTLALVGQVAKNLGRLLPDDQEVTPSTIDDQLYAGLDSVLSGNVTVMTPERCLLLTTILPDAFSDVGLVVFDECHSLHMPPNDPNVRSVDAMLCLLRLMNIAPDTDVLLLSAMMNNGPELAGWLQDAYGKEALSFDAAWKPTRQARGSIIFKKGEIETLQRLLDSSQKNLPQSQMRAVPHSLVCM